MRSRKADILRRETDSIPQQVARLQSLPQSVIGFGCDYPKGVEVTKHRHPRGQLIYASEGTLRVTVANRVWIIPPSRAIWVPPNVEHGFIMISAASIRTLYVKPSSAKQLPKRALAIVVSPLLRELLVSAAALKPQNGSTTRGNALLKLTVLEMQSCVAEPLSLHLPRHPRLVAIANAMLTDLANEQSLDALAEQHGMSQRTLRRRFIADVGIAPGQWRQQAKLLFAFASIVNGTTITQAAGQSGYESPSAFAAAFRRVFGQSPTKYLANA